MEEEANDNAMDIDSDDGSSDNAMAEQANQSNEREEKINLLEMPREILEHMLVQLDDDKDLLTASHVCKLFASVAETAFARKYSNEYYVLSYFGWIGKLLNESDESDDSDDPDDPDEREKSFDNVILRKYGARIRWISVQYGDGENLDLIDRNCHNLERIKLIDVPKVIHLKNLKEILLEGVGSLSRDTFREFISQNQQLESLLLHYCQLNLIGLLDGTLNSLKTLEYVCYNELTVNLPKIRLNSLEALKLYSSQNQTIICILRALECNQLKQLDLMFSSGSDEVIDSMCKFETLVSLQMMHFPVTEIQLKKLAAHLPHLTELGIRSAEEKQDSISKDISFVLSIFPKLSKLTIHLNNDEDFDQFACDAENFINEFYARFADANTEIQIAVDNDVVFMSKDFVYVKNGLSLELYWMANLNDKNVREVAKHLYASDLKFINNCSGQTLDICTFLTEYKRLECLDIKSDGPITFKENSSRHHNFFPRLKILKLHLDDRNAINFLEKLDSIFCERIEELCLDTKSGASRDQELEQTHDMTNILVKFKNLTSLNLAPAFGHFDSKLVFSVCQNLKDLHMHR